MCLGWPPGTSAPISECLESSPSPITNSILLLMCTLGGTDGGSSTWVPMMHVGALYRHAGFWLLSGPLQAIASNWGVKQRMKSLWPQYFLLFAFQVKVRE